MTASRIGVIPPEQYQQKMSWQLCPPKEDDKDKVPQAVRMFKPNFDTFEAVYTTTNLSVDNLVEHCTAAGYIKGPAKAALPAASQGALTMAVQPTLTQDTAATSQLTTGTYSTFADDVPMSPMSLNLFGALQTALTEPSPTAATFATSGPTLRQAMSVPLAVGEQALMSAVGAVELSGAVYPYNDLFDPTSKFDISFDPNESNGLADGGVYDAFDPAATATAMSGQSMLLEEMLALDWSQFVNED